MSVALPQEKQHDLMLRWVCRDNCRVHKYSAKLTIVYIHQNDTTGNTEGTHTHASTACGSTNKQTVRPAHTILFGSRHRYPATRLTQNPLVADPLQS